MAPHFTQVRNVTNVITFPIPVVVHMLHWLPGNLFHQLKCFDDRDRVLPPTAKVVNLCASRALNKQVHETRYIEGVNVVANLFPLVTKNFIGLPL